MLSVDVCDDLDQIVAKHDLAYLQAKSVTDKWKADAKLMWRHPQTKTEKLVRALMEYKRHKYGAHNPVEVK